MAIYNYNRLDDDGYRRTLEVREGHLGDRLVFDTAPRDSNPSVILPREDVARLRDALTEWLGDKPLMTPETLDERVREIVQDELRRIQVPGATPLPSSLLTEETPEEVWGGSCATCGHSTGVHLPVLGCEHPDGCECAWPDTSAPVLSRTPAELADEIYAEIGPPPAPKCGCGHEVRRHGPEAGCVECKCTWTGSAPAPEPVSAPECTCEHGRVIHNEYGCGFLGGCECTWKYV